MILHVYSGNLFGGIETNLLTLCAADVARSAGGSPHRHSVALSFDATLARRLREAGASCSILGPVRFRYPWTAWVARKRLRRTIRNASIHGIVAHGAWAYRLAEPVARRAKVPVALWNHDRFQVSGPLERYLIEHPPDLLIGNSRYTAGTLAQAFGRQVDEVIFPVSHARPIETASNARSTIRKEMVTPESAVVIILFSRFERLKGHSVLLESLQMLRHRDDWHCWLVGGVQRPEDAAYRDELLKFAQSAGISDRIRFVGHRDDIPAILAAADIHCQPNVGPDSFGLTYVEALAAGLPSIGSELGGVPEILDTECGRLVPPGDSERLRATLEELIDRQDLRQSLGDQGRVRAISLRDVTGNLENLESLFANYTPARTKR
jgi:glycosyltransferase involved in cell wall biosynthesis